MDYSPLGFSVHGILQARILEWVAISFSRGSSRPRDWTQVAHIAGRRFNLWATREVCWIVAINYKLATCLWPLPSTSTRIKSGAAATADFQHPWKRFRMESKNETLCAGGQKTGRTGLQIVRYFHELILWTQFFYFPPPRKALKSFMVTTVPHDQQKASQD